MYLQTSTNNSHNNDNNSNTINSRLIYSRSMLLLRQQFATEPSFAATFRLEYNEILDLSLCSFKCNNRSRAMHQHFVHECKLAVLAAALFNELVRLFLCLRRHCDHPPPGFHRINKPPRPPEAAAAGPATLTKKLPSLIVTNANHLTNKIELLNGLLDDSNVDLAFITETWFDADNSTVMKRRLHKHYHALSATRDDRGEEKDGGGALALVKKSYASHCLPIAPTLPPPPSWFATSKRANDPPLAIDLKIVKLRPAQLPRGFSSVLAVCVYIAEFSSDKVRQDAAIYQVTFAINAAAKCSSIGIKPLILVAGDFNGANTSYLCSSLQLHKLSNKSTHKKGGSLDLVFTNAPKCYTTKILEPLGKSDHNIVYCYAEQPAYKNLLSTPTTRLVRSGKIADTVHILRNTDWTPITASAHIQPQATMDEFYSYIEAAQDFCQPLTPLKVRVDQPWMTAHIQQGIDRRLTLFRAGERRSAEYKIHSELVEREIHLAKRKYIKRKFSLSKPSYWKLVNDYREIKQTANEDPALASALNDGFYSVWNGIAQPDLTAYTAMSCPPPTTPLFTAANVALTLKELNTSSPGPDGISATLLKYARYELCDPIAHMFNAWLAIGFVPAQWRAASITPIAKVDHPAAWSDYRPISLTSNLCKVFEKVLVKYIVGHTSAIWVDNNQYGFLPGRSTLDAALTVIFDLESAHDRSIPWLAVFFDFAKAFDLVPHDTLLMKLANILPPWLVRWIACYLSNRTQRVRVGEITTEWKKVEAGVIQGSVLGPVLFILFIADINKYLPKGVRFSKYADDIIAYIIGKPLKTDLPKQVVEAVEKWCVDNGMRLNVNKCKVMHSKTSQSPEITLNQVILESVDVYKYLGFHINPSFDAKLQWNRVQPLISQNIALLKQLNSCGLCESILVAIFKSLVLSHFHYSSTLLVACPAGTIADMQVLQNTLLRTIGITREAAKTKYGIVDVSEYIKSSCIAQVTRILNQPSHTLTASLRSARKTHSAFPFTIPIPRKEAFKQNSVMVTLVHLRDNVYGTGRAVPPARPPPPPQLLPAPALALSAGVPCSNPACKCPTKLWLRLDLHLKSCLAKNPSPMS